MSSHYRIRNKRVADLVLKAQASGWRVEHGSKHLRLFPPDPSVPIMTISTTEADSGRKWLNQRGEMRKRGLDV